MPAVFPFFCFPSKSIISPARRLTNALFSKVLNPFPAALSNCLIASLEGKSSIASLSFFQLGLSITCCARRVVKLAISVAFNLLVQPSFLFPNGPVRRSILSNARVGARTASARLTPLTTFEKSVTPPIVSFPKRAALIGLPANKSGSNKIVSAKSKEPEIRLNVED